ncbi:hypothetical protein ACIBJD_29570 [Kitasatospora sp. NPDC050467]|uniref:hypothetical protein n=1 Tax=Kitasatospora sp. NPDC050467 TaxID=3364053 RepID=UPI0037B633E4
MIDPEGVAALAYRERDLEAFTAFLGGVLAAGLLALALAGIGALVEPAPWHRNAAAVLLAAAWLSSTVGIYRRLLSRAARRTPGSRGTLP